MAVDTARECNGAMEPVTIGPGPVSCDDVLAVARLDAPVVLGADALHALEQARGVVEALAGAATPAYGIST